MNPRSRKIPRSRCNSERSRPFLRRCRFNLPPCRPSRPHLAASCIHFASSQRDLASDRTISRQNTETLMQHTGLSSGNPHENSRHEGIMRQNSQAREQSLEVSLQNREILLPCLEICRSWSSPRGTFLSSCGISVPLAALWATLAILPGQASRGCGAANPADSSLELRPLNLVPCFFLWPRRRFLSDRSRHLDRPRARRASYP